MTEEPDDTTGAVDREAEAEVRRRTGGIQVGRRVTTAAAGALLALAAVVVMYPPGRYPTELRDAGPDIGPHVAPHIGGSPGAGSAPTDHPGPAGSAIVGAAPARRATNGSAPAPRGRTTTGPVSTSAVSPAPTTTSPDAGGTAAPSDRPARNQGTAPAPNPPSTTSPSSTAPGPSTGPPRDPIVDEPGAEPGGEVLRADLTPEFDATSTGKVELYRTDVPGTWDLHLGMDATVPDVDHVVSVQHRTADGGLSPIATVGQARSSASGRLTCDARFAMVEGTEPALVTVAGLDPRSGGFRTIGYGSLLHGS